jgi:hypothetical protein
MGWLFGWHTRKELAEHLLSNKSAFDRTIKHAWKGNNLWVVREVINKDGTAERFIALYMCKGNGRVEYDPHNWGYKDMDETAGPSATSCPLSFLDMVPDPRIGYSTEWRARVRERAAKAAQKFTVGQRVKLYRREYTITEVLGRGKYRLDGIYTSTPKHIRHMEVVE